MALRIRRLAASISAGIEEVVTKLENHEAVADCMLEDLRRGIAQIRIQQARIDKQAKRTAKQLQEAEQDHTRWNARALQLAETDEAKALQCIQRAEYSDKAARTLHEQRVAHESAVDELGARIVELESQLSDLTLKRASLSSRELNAKAGRTVISGDGAESANQLFDRWEAAVMTDEYAGGVGSLGGQNGGQIGAQISSDVLEREFAEEENRVSLKSKLEALKQQQDRGES